MLAQIRFHWRNLAQQLQRNLQARRKREVLERFDKWRCETDSESSISDSEDSVEPVSEDSFELVD